MITDATPHFFVEMSNSMWRERGNNVSTEQSAKNLVIIALRKIRNMLGPMGLAKGPIEAHRTIEPIGPAVAPFDGLRMAVRDRAQRDAMKIINDTGNRERIENFWGIKLPKNYYDIEAGQHGKANVTGQFDNLIRQVVEASQNKSVEYKINLLKQFAEII